jgi:hypothetical protein
MSTGRPRPREEGERKGNRAAEIRGGVAYNFTYIQIARAKHERLRKYTGGRGVCAYTWSNLQRQTMSDVQ